MRPARYIAYSLLFHLNAQQLDPFHLLFIYYSRLVCAIFSSSDGKDLLNIRLYQRTLSSGPQNSFLLQYSCCILTLYALFIVLELSALVALWQRTEVDLSPAVRFCSVLRDDYE